MISVPWEFIAAEARKVARVDYSFKGFDNVRRGEDVSWVQKKTLEEIWHSFILFENRSYSILDCLGF